MDPENIVEKIQDPLPLKTEEILGLIGKIKGEPEMRVLVFMDIFDKIKDYKVLTCTNYDYFKNLLSGPDAVSLSDEGLYNRIHESILCNFGVMGGMTAQNLKDIYGINMDVLDDVKGIIDKYLDPESDYKKRIEKEVTELKEKQQLEEELRVAKKLNLAEFKEIKDYIAKIKTDTAVGSFRNTQLQKMNSYEKIRKLLSSVLNKVFTLENVEETDDVMVDIDNMMNQLETEIKQDYDKAGHTKIYVILKKMQKGIAEETMPKSTKPSLSDVFVVPAGQTGGYNSDHEMFSSRSSRSSTKSLSSSSFGGSSGRSESSRSQSPSQDSTKSHLTVNSDNILDI